MRFSIIIPAYNAERSLRRCLNSVKNQVFTDYEAIVVDDGSADQTAAIADEFAREDPRFRCVRQNNQGVSAARNSGIRSASGEYIVFLDSDDEYVPEYLCAFERMIAQYQECDHFWCGFRSVDASGNRLEDYGYADCAGKVFVTDRSQIMSLHEKTLDASLWNKAFRKSILDENQLRLDEGLSLGEDLLFNYAYLNVSRTQIVIYDCPLYLYTKAKHGTLDSMYRENLKDIYDIINDGLLDYLKKWRTSQEEMSKYYRSVFYLMERALYNTYRPECTWSSAQKRRYNNGLMRSDRFQTALKRTEGMHPLYRRAYEMGEWTLIRILDELVKMKRAFMRR